MERDMTNYNDFVELELVRINGQYWGLREKDSDNQLIAESNISYINRNYGVDLLGSIRIPLEYLEYYREKNSWLC